MSLIFKSRWTRFCQVERVLTRRRSFSAFSRWKHAYSVQSSRFQEIETIDVPCRSNGHVTVNIHRPLVADDPASPIIIYLPTGPIPVINVNKRQDGESAIIESLIAGSNATVLQINYRLGDGVRYPTPIHDILYAYDWFKDQLDKTSISQLRSHPSLATRRISDVGVCGQLLGGSLATMLTLTENKTGGLRTTAFAVNNPIVDWIVPESLVSSPGSEESMPVDPNEQGELMEDERDLDNMREAASSLTTTTKRKRAKKEKPPTSWESYASSPPLTTEALLDTRKSILRSAAATFDPFVSPILFFRSPGAAIPAPFEPTEAEIADMEEALDTLAPEAMLPTVYRKVHRKFPPRGSDLTIPKALLMLHGGTVLLDQGLELATLMRRSVSRGIAEEMGVGKRTNGQVGPRGNEGTDVEDQSDQIIWAAEREAEGRVTVAITRGINQGIWGSKTDSSWKRDVEGVGGWLREALSRPSSDRTSKL